MRKEYKKRGNTVKEMKRAERKVDRANTEKDGNIERERKGKRTRQREKGERKKERKKEREREEETERSVNFPLLSPETSLDAKHSSSSL